MSYKKSLLVGLAMYYFQKSDEIENKLFKKDNIRYTLIRLFIASVQVLISFMVVLLVQFIEYPIRYLIFKGKFQDKFNYWLYSWKRIYEGAKKGWE